MRKRRARPEAAFHAALRLTARLVPARLRDEWLREWRAESAHTLRRRWVPPLRIVRWALNAVIDAAYLRYEEVRMGGMGSYWPALRVLVRNPVFTVVVLLTLAAGVGANAAIFSLADWALFRPVPGVSRPDMLISIVPEPASGEGIAPISHPTFTRLEGGVPGLASLAAYTPVPVDLALRPGGEPLRVQGQLVTPSFFGTLGVAPARGRFFDRSEGGASSVRAVAVLAHDFWRTTLDSDPDVLGRSLVLNGATFEVVAVAPPGFHGPERTSAVDVWVPTSSATLVLPRMPADVLTRERAPVWVQLVGRRAGPVPADEIAAHLDRTTTSLDRDGVRFRVAERFGTSPWLEGRMSRSLAVAGGLVATLLLLTAANLTNLMLSRLSRRGHEIVIRRALGATPGRLTFEVALEALLLSVAGGVLAVGAGWAILAAVDGVRLLSDAPELPALRPDVRVLGFALGVAALTMGLVTVLAVGALRRYPATAALRRRRGGDAPRRVRRGLVVAQVGLSLALVAGAGLMVRSLRGLDATALGFELEGLVVFSLNPGVQGYGDDASDALFRDLLGELRGLPEVEAVGFTWLEPLSARRYTESVSTVGGERGGEWVTMQANMVSPGYLDALGIGVLEGRDFDDREFDQRERPDRGDVLLSRAAAELLFPGEETAVGREVRMEGRRESAFEVVGVVEDARLPSVKKEPGPYLFDPFGNGYRTTSATFAVRGHGDPERLLSRLREVVRGRDPALPLLAAGSMEEKIDATLSETHTLGRILGLFAALSLLLAGTGLFGLVTESVQARIHEFGVRRALGAGAGRVVGLVLVESFSLVGLGVLTGLAVAVGLARMLRSYLIGIEPLDGPTFLFASVVLLAAGLVATVGPIFRSLRADPLESLKAD